MRLTRKLLSASIMCACLTGPAAANEAEKLGTVSFPISCTGESQQGFDRAVAMLHNFWFPQAGNAFADVAKADPECAMAYWGVAISARANPLVGTPPPAAMKRGWEYVEKAKSAAP